MPRLSDAVSKLAQALALFAFSFSLWATDEPPKRALDIHPKPIASDASIKYDYDIVYVRAPRKGDDKQISWTDVFNPFRAEPGSDLVLLHPNGTEEMLVAAGKDAIADPFVSFDGEWVYYARIHNVNGAASDLYLPHSADIFKIHVKSRKIVQLTKQEFTPNTGVVARNLSSPGVFNMGPCPLPGGRLIFTSNRNGFISTKDYHGWAATPGYVNNSSMQLYVMDDDGKNVELIGHLNINGALHPTILKDGRVMFTTFESEGLRDPRGWALWAIHPDGTHWEPIFSGLGASSETARHFMTQLSDGHIIAEEYYFQHAIGFGTFYKMNATAPSGEAYFGSAAQDDPRNLAIPKFGRVPFSSHGMVELTRFSHFGNAPAHRSDPNDPKSPRSGKVTHPSGAPDNNLLLVWSPGPNYGLFGNDEGVHRFEKPATDSGLYLIKNGQVVEEPGQMFLIKNDPKYNEQWPRAVVPYKRIYGVDEPDRLPEVANDGAKSKQLPEGSPFGLVGTSSLYKRESYPHGYIAPGQVTAWAPKAADDPYEGLGGLAWSGVGGNWFEQGAEAGKYDNSDVHAIRILITEPTTDPRYAGRVNRLWWNAANERLRILGEFPVRKFNGDQQPVDPDGNPDTSFLVKLPADVAWTFQMLDKNGMVLNMAQTWHQLRPGEIRTDCGGCHAHSQVPTPFEKTAAAQPNYTAFDLTTRSSFLTTKKNDQSGKKWDKDNETGLRFEAGAKNVEFFRDVKPILDRSCVACHTQSWEKPAGNLILDDNQPVDAGEDLVTLLVGNPPSKVPGTYMRLALDARSKYGYKSHLGFRDNQNPWSFPQASRYIRFFQSRRSLLVWKIYGRRLDGFKNDDFAYEAVPGDPDSMIYKGEPYKAQASDMRTMIERSSVINLAYTGSVMPPTEAVAGTYVGPHGQKIKVPTLSDEDRLTIVRWIDLGCPIDFDFDPSNPKARGHGWMEDDFRPTLTLTYPRAGVNTDLTRILIGMYDYDSGLDLNTFQVVAGLPIDAVPAGQNLASRFKSTGQGVWELKLSKPITSMLSTTLTVSVKDKQGNETRIVRQFSVGGRKRTLQAMNSH